MKCSKCKLVSFITNNRTAQDGLWPSQKSCVTPIALHLLFIACGSLTSLKDKKAEPFEHETTTYIWVAPITGNQAQSFLPSDDERFVAFSLSNTNRSPVSCHMCQVRAQSEEIGDTFHQHSTSPKN